MRKALLMMLLVCGCGGPGDESVASIDEAIQGGAKDAKDPAVGMVWISNGSLCTGALIAPDIVLTAGHCTDAPVTAFYTGKGKGAHTVGQSPAGGLVVHPVVEQVAHPSYRAVNQCPNPTFDVALLRLAKPIPKARPLSLAAMAPAVGATCRAVGYGVHNDRSGMTVELKRSATEKVVSVDAGSLVVTRKSGIVDEGDTGGPLLCGGAIAGTASCSNDGAYPAHRTAHYARVDAASGWIQQTIADWSGDGTD